MKRFLMLVCMFVLVTNALSAGVEQYVDNKNTATPALTVEVAANIMNDLIVYKNAKCLYEAGKDHEWEHIAQVVSEMNTGADYIIAEMQKDPADKAEVVAAVEALMPDAKINISAGFDALSYYYGPDGAKDFATFKALCQPDVE